MANKKPNNDAPKKTKGFLGMFKKDIDSVMKNGYTRLQLAARINDIKKLRSLINLGAEVDFSGTRGPEERPLAIALDYYNIDIAQILLQHGADPNHHILGKTYLSRAVELRSPTLIDHLLTYKADAKLRDLWTNETPIFHVHDSDPHFIDALVRHGCDINAENHEGYTALYKAVTFRKFRLADALLKRGATPNITPEGAPDLLQLVLENVSNTRDPLWGLVKPLIAAGSDPNTLLSDQRSLYMQAVMLQDLNMMQYAVKTCDNIQQMTNNGSTPLHMALQTQNPAVIHAVLNIYNKCPAGKNTDGQSVVTQMMAQRDFYLDRPSDDVRAVINRIFDMGGNPDAQDKTASTMLHWAVKYQDMAMVEMLLKHGPALDLRDQDGHTALSLAVHYNNLEMVDLLLDEGADPNIANDKGWTILDLMSLNKGDRTSPMVQRLIASGGRYVKQLPANDHAPTTGQMPEIKKPPAQKGKAVKPPKPF